jgi:hypothetical protein
MWAVALAAFLVGAACGGWFSRRRAVAQAFVAGHVSGEANAMAYAQGGSVTINESRSNGCASCELRMGDDLDRLESDIQRDAIDVGRDAALSQYFNNGRGLGDPRAHVVKRLDRQVTDHG